VVESRLSLRVVPGASKNEIIGWIGEELKIRVAAPPEAGKANQRVCELLASALGVGKGAVTLVTGALAKRKIVAISGLDLDVVRRRLADGGFV
jgi:uncharacterized protein (TIGR00251 family)